MASGIVFINTDKNKSTYIVFARRIFSHIMIIIIIIIIILIIIIIIIISILKEDNVFSIIASLPYGPPVNTDIDYYQTFSDFYFF